MASLLEQVKKNMQRLQARVTPAAVQSFNSAMAPPRQVASAIGNVYNVAKATAKEAYNPMTNVPATFRRTGEAIQASTGAVSGLMARNQTQMQKLPTPIRQAVQVTNAPARMSVNFMNDYVRSYGNTLQRIGSGGTNLAATPNPIKHPLTFLSSPQGEDILNTSDVVPVGHIVGAGLKSLGEGGRFLVKGAKAEEALAIFGSKEFKSVEKEIPHLKQLITNLKGNEMQVMEDFIDLMRNRKIKIGTAEANEIEFGAHHLAEELGISARDVPNRKLTKLFDDVLTYTRQLDSGRSVTEAVGPNKLGFVGDVKKGLPQLSQEGKIGKILPERIGQPPIAKLGNSMEKVAPQGLNSSVGTIGSQELNVNRLGLNEAQKAEVQGLQSADTIKQKLSNKDIVQLGERVGIDTKSHTIDETAKKIAEQYNQRREVSTLKQQFDRMRAEGAPLSELEKITVQMAKASKVATEQGTDIARQLQARRIIANEFDSPMQKIFKLFNNAGVNEEVFGKEAAKVDFNNPDQVIAFYRKFVPPTAAEWIDKIRYNSMLSSPMTQIVNASSNFQGTGVLTPIQKTIEGGIDATVSALTGRDRTRFAGEGAEYAKGYYGSVRKAWTNLTNVFKNNSAIIENPDTRSIPLASGGAGKVVENVLDLPTKALEGMDQFFKTLTSEGLERANKLRVSKGAPAGLSAADEADKLLFRGNLTEPGAGVVSNFVGSGAEWVKRATQSKNATFRWLAKLTLPFVNIGTNLAKAGAESNPILGSINMIGNADKTAQAAKMIMGGTVMAVGGSLALSDRLTFGEPTGESDKKMYRSAGMQPYSFKVGDKWVSYSKLHPLVGFQLGMVAALNDAFKKKKLDESTTQVIAEGMVDFLQFTADQTYFKNIGDFVNTVSGDAEGLSKLASNYPSQLIPFRAMAGWITRIVDQYQRQPDTDASFVTKTLQQMATQIPGLSTMVPPRLGVDGKPIENPNRITNAFSPARVSTENPDKAQQYRFVQKAKQAEKLKTDTDTKTATEIFDKVSQATTREEKLRILKQGEKDGTITPSVKTKIKNLLKEGKDVSSEAGAIGSITSNMGKAHYIVSKVKSMTSREEKLAYLKQLEAEGVMTDNLKQQIKELLKSK